LIKGSQDDKLNKRKHISKYHRRKKVLENPMAIISFSPFELVESLCHRE
jgi:hypothetical protein